VLDHRRLKCDGRLYTSVNRGLVASTRINNLATFSGFALLGRLQILNAVGPLPAAACQTLLLDLLVRKPGLPTGAARITLVVTEAALLLHPFHEFKKLSLTLFALLSPDT
jgi:hypothetical protein